MYKLIIGTVRISVDNDAIPHNKATALARQAINEAAKNNKLLSYVQISGELPDLEVHTTEKTGTRSSRKTLKQSMLDSIYSSVQEKLNPPSEFSVKDVWCDNDTGQEWHGQECTLMQKEIIKKFEDWLKTV